MEDAHVDINVNYSRKLKNYYTELKGDSNVRKLIEEAVCNSASMSYIEIFVKKTWPL